MTALPANLIPPLLVAQARLGLTPIILSMISPTQQSLINAQLAPAATGQAISSAVAVKSLDAAKLQGAAILKLLDSAAQAAQQQPAPGDPLVAKATGLGTLLDVTA
jgi:hypothetical protein